MSLEMLRFGWQKLLVNQVPQKGGGGYGPPPPDYAGQWNAAQQAFDDATAVVQYAQSEYAKFASNPALAPPIINAVNERANAELSKIDGIINQTSGIPDYIFANGNLTKGDALNILQNTRNNVARCINIVPPPPPPPPIPVQPPPPTSSTLDQAAIDAAQSAALSAKLGYDTTQYRSVPMPIGDFQPIGCIPGPVIRYPIDEVIDDNQNPLSTQDGEWVPTGKIEGVGTYIREMGVGAIYGQSVMVFSEDGDQHSSPQTVPRGLKWSYKPWRWVPKSHATHRPSDQSVQNVPKTELEVLQAELNRQLKQLQAINRVLNKPIDPVPPQNIYPTTSWQYEFWSKGYSLNEIHYAEDQAAQKNLLTTTNGDFNLFKLKVEDLLQDAIISKAFNPPLDYEIVPTDSTGTDANGNPILVVTSDPPILVPDWDKVTPLKPMVPTLEIPPVPPCQLPVPYYDNRGNRINPKKLPAYLRRTRQFQSRGVRNRPIDINDMNDVPTVCPSVMPRVGNWEDCIIGRGATIAELDTLRRTMAQTKLTPNADICNVADLMLTRLRQTTGGVGYEDRTGVYATPPAPPTTNNVNPVNNIPGVKRCGVSAATMVKSNAIAQKKAQQARRGVLNSRNIKK